MTADVEVASAPAVRAERWPTELPLFALVLLASGLLWLVLAISIFGAMYAAVIVAALFFAHVVTVAHIRGSGVKLGPDQFPELHRRVHELSRAAGIERVPDAYLMQEGGALNAFATKFLRSRLIVLFSDLLEACGDDTEARDMVIGHELGHVKSGHLDWMWLIAPGMFVPFLGSAYSRAREYTCDRWGAALCGDSGAAVRGLVILAAGGRLARAVDPRAFVRQRRDLDTGWMTLGRWLSTYPPLCERVAALESSLAEGVPSSTCGPMRALGLLAGAMVLFAMIISAFAALLVLPAIRNAARTLEQASALDPGFDDDTTPEPTPPVEELGIEAATAKAQGDFDRIGELIAVYLQAFDGAPQSLEDLADLWQERYAPEPFPVDPFDGLAYGYEATESEVVLWSSGADGESASADDLRRRIALQSEL